MPSLSDHTRRDAEHAARSEISVNMSRYARRMAEHAKAHINEAIEAASLSGESVDGTGLGKAAAIAAINTYIGIGEPRAAVDTTASEAPVLGSGGAA